MNYYQSSPASSLDIYELICLINVNILSRTMVQVLLSEKQGDRIRMVDSPEAKQALWMKCFVCSFHGCSWAHGPATLKRQQTPWSPSCRWLGPSSLETQYKLGSRRQGRLWRWNLSLTEMDRYFRHGLSNLTYNVSFETSDSSFKRGEDAAHSFRTPCWFPPQYCVKESLGLGM